MTAIHGYNGGPPPNQTQANYTPGYVPAEQMPKVINDLEQQIEALRQKSNEVLKQARPQTVELSEEDDAEFVQLAERVCKGVFHMLVEKNRKYGNSALNPVRIFSKADTKEQLFVRCDDKLSRIKRGTEDNEDTIVDLIGYLILIKIADEIGGV